MEALAPILLEKRKRWHRYFLSLLVLLCMQSMVHWSFNDEHSGLRPVNWWDPDGAISREESVGLNL